MSVLECIGGTPTVRIKDNLYVKVESKNPSGSVKDRATLYMLRSANLPRGSTVVEPTSGNTGISLAMLSAALGYSAKIVMPKEMSRERAELIRAYGGEVILVEGGVGEAIQYAKDLVSQTESAFMPDQFNNPENVRAHFETTGPEIYRDTEGVVDILVCGVGSGGTITGVGRFLKSIKKSVKVIAVEPTPSPDGRHKIQGIGAGFLPPLYDKTVVDKTMYVSDEDAFLWARRLAREYGIFSGISSGAAFSVANLLAEKNMDKRIVVILPDGGDRYLSCGLFS